MSLKHFGKPALGLFFLFGSCVSEEICLQNPDHPACRYDVSLSPKPTDSFIYLERDTPLAVHISKRREGQQQNSYPVWFVDRDSPEKAARVGDAMYVNEVADAGGLFNLILAKNNPQLAVRHTYAVRVGVPGSESVPTASSDSEPLLVTVKRPIGYQEPSVYVQKAQALTGYPRLRLLGVVDNTLVAVGSGMDGTGIPKQKLKTFLWSQTILTTGLVGTFWDTLFDSSVSMTLTGDRVLLPIPTMSVWAKCGSSADFLTDCATSSAPTIPMDMVGLAGSTDKQWIGYLGKDGNVQVASSTGGVWSKLGGPTAMGKATKGIWFADVNGDKQEDLVTAWQGPGLELKVFLRKDSGFVEDPRWSEALGSIGTADVSSMTVDDLDTDGYADVVVAKGLTIEAYQSVAGDGAKVGKMIKAWSRTLNAAQAGPEVQSLTVGKLAGGDASVSPDLVAATYACSSMTNRCDVYLYAFRAMN